MPEKNVLGKNDGSVCNGIYVVPEEDIVGKKDETVRLSSRT